MVQKKINQLCIFAALLTCSSIIEPKLTTLKQFDPSPNYSGNDSMMPPNSQFLDLTQARIKHEEPCKRRVLGVNISGFVQKAVRARGYSGNYEYGSVLGAPQGAFELGDFRGTMYPMGLFLGTNPNTGKNIWGTGTDNGNPADITSSSIAAFGLPNCLSNIAKELSGNGTNIYPLVFTTATLPTTSKTGTSIFSADELAEDTVYFGAFSLPIEYQQAGLRWEINVNCGDHIGLTIQSGFSNMKQYYVNNITTPTQTGQTALGPYSLTDLVTTGTSPAPVSNLYAELNEYVATQTSTTATAAQAIFDQNISDNIAAILNPDCIGSDPLCAFEDYSLDDVKVILSFKGIFEPYRYRHEDDDDAGSWPDMIFVPYAWVGGSFPTAKKTHYRNILSLPFGNNGHASAGGAVGMTFDFADSVEVGVEGGATYFFAQDETRPFPTHRLQRVLYPFEAHVNTQPGINWHFRALLNAYQFLKHINFWMTYELIEHKKDSFTFCHQVNPQYFVPEVLTCRSDWRAQFFNAGLSFDIRPGMQASLVWQQPISPRNAYYPVSILGSVNFLF